jgi:hypothetical protein
MAYSDFTTLNKVQSEFDLTLLENRNLFSDIPTVKPSDHLTQILDEYLLLATAINTEKARSEFLIAPVLAEVRRQLKFQVGLFSGTEFDVDKDRGLSGYCDYLLSGSSEQYFIKFPVMMIVEAKNENIKAGLGQCIAEMVAAQIFNQRENQRTFDIYGIVSTGTTWKFLRLESQTVYIDTLEYYINQVDKILGIMIQFAQTVLTLLN